MEGHLVEAALNVLGHISGNFGHAKKKRHEQNVVANPRSCNEPLGAIIQIGFVLDKNECGNSRKGTNRLNSSIARSERDRLCTCWIWVEGETPFIR